MSEEFMRERPGISQIARAHASARPKHDNPAWLNSHRELGVALEHIATQAQELQRLRDIIKTQSELNNAHVQANAIIAKGNQQMRAHIQEAADSLKRANIQSIDWEDRNAIGNALNELYTALKEHKHG